MKKSTSLSVFLLLVLAVGASHIGWTTRDNGLLMELDGREIDVPGLVADRWTRLTRNCKSVERLQSDDQTYQSVVSLIADYSPPHSASVRLASVWETGKWVLAEAEFADLLPAVVLIDFSGPEPRIISNAVWSGYTKPWKAAPFIRQYLARQVPQLPPSLSACFDPQSPSFR